MILDFKASMPHFEKHKQTKFREEKGMNLLLAKEQRYTEVQYAE